MTRKSSYLLTSETRRKISESLQGHTVSKRVRRLLSKAAKRQWKTGLHDNLAAIMQKHRHSDKIKAKISLAMTGRSVSQKTRDKLSHKATGRKHTLASRMKMSAARKGRPVPQVTRAKIARTMTGTKRGPMPLELRQRLSNIHKGKVQGAEHRKKISEGIKKHWRPINPERRVAILERNIRAALKARPPLAETRMNAILKHARIHYRWQYHIGTYFADFYLTDYKVVVECDGETHKTAQIQNKDKIRDGYFRSKNLTVLHFADQEILNTPEKVEKTILRHVASVLMPRPCTLND